MALRPRWPHVLFALLRVSPNAHRFSAAPTTDGGIAMQLPQVNYLAVLVAGLVIFLIGGLWYSPLLFAKKWIALQGRTEEQMRADAAGSNMPLMYLGAFICGIIIA